MRPSVSLVIPMYNEELNIERAVAASREALERYASERGISLLEVAIGGLAAQPAVSSVIAGATRPEQVRANAAAADWIPSAEDLATLNALA